MSTREEKPCNSPSYFLSVSSGSPSTSSRAPRKVAIPYARETDRCAVRALSQWLQAANIHRGPVFRRLRRGDTVSQVRLTDQSVALIIKRRARTAPPSR
jgi:hypothetical protein